MNTASSLIYPHLNSTYTGIDQLTAASSIIAEHQGKIAAVLKGGFDTDKKLRARKHNLDGLAIAAALDAPKLKSDTDKLLMYAVYYGGFMKIYGDDQARARKGSLDTRPSLVHLRRALSIGENGNSIEAKGQVSRQVFDAWEAGLKEHEQSGIDMSASAMADRLRAGGAGDTDIRRTTS
jgi:hypothetical protein